MSPAGLLALGLIALNSLGFERRDPSITGGLTAESIGEDWSSIASAPRRYSASCAKLYRLRFSIRRVRHAEGMIHRHGPAVEAFAAAGWEWGGNWPRPKDYQHFSATGN